ncbi:MAG: DeoR family transcriptional regulator [Pygmaiobacter massiliensis]
MYKEERLIGTLSLIEQKRVVTIEDLANELYISPSTVRRDLAELAKRGLIARTSGGAVAVTEMKKNDLMGEISGILPVENALGARAENLIPQKSTIFLSASLPLSMVPPLENRPNLRVVTDSAQIANSLCGKGVQIFVPAVPILPHKIPLPGGWQQNLHPNFSMIWSFYPAMH